MITTAMFTVVLLLVVVVVVVGAMLLLAFSVLWKSLLNACVCCNTQPKLC